MIKERAMLIAREVIAKKKEADQAPHSAALVRSGAWDDDTEVANAYLGALAALESMGEAVMWFVKPNWSKIWVEFDNENDANRFSAFGNGPVMRGYLATEQQR